MNSFERFSYSMIFDKDTEVPKTIQRQYYTHYAESRPRAVWVEDNDIQTCQRCKCEFSVFTRKHHCRHCGRIYCYNCCNTWMKIDAGIRKSLTSHTSMFYKEGKERVCKDCSISLKLYKTVQKLFNVFNLIGLDVKDMMILGQVHRQWYRVSTYYINIFRNIQYRIPQSINKVEARMLHNNVRLIRGHSLWTIQYCKLLNSDYYHKELKGISKQNIISLFKRVHGKVPSCWSLRCTRRCTRNLQPSDIMLCLNSCFNVDDELLKIVLLNFNCCPSDEMKCYLPLIVLLFNEPTLTDTRSKILQTYLIKKSSSSLDLCHTLFWLYSKAIEQNRKVYYPIRTFLLQHIPKRIKKQIQTSYEYVGMLKECSRVRNTHDIKRKLQLYSNECLRNMVTYPLKTDLIIIRNNVDELIEKASKCKPIIIPLECMHKGNNGLSEERIMIKKDDLRKDAIIMNCITLMNKILKRHGMDLNIVTYVIMPITHELGIMEIVPKSETIHDIKVSNFSIQNYIFEHNSTGSINKIREKYMKSCAAYCLIGYLLGIGDRHLENIMITQDGYIFHIDFEFILGCDPKLIRPEIRITPEMIDAMGGFESKFYQEFQNICKKGFKILRLHADIIYNQLMLLTKLHPVIDKYLTADYIRSQVMKRFMIGETHEDAELLFITKVANSSSSSYQHNFVDYVHEQGTLLTSIGNRLQHVLNIW